MAKKRNMLLSVITRLVVCMALLGLGVAGVAVLWVTRDQPVPVTDPDARPSIEVMKIQSVPVRRQFEGHGTAAAFRAANVPAQVRGIVISIDDNIVEGTPIERGQIIAQLDDSDYRREVEIRQQQVADTEALLRRLQIEYVAAEQRLELASGDVEMAEADMERVLRAAATSGATDREVDQQRQQLAARMRERVLAWEHLEQIEPRRMQLQAAQAQQESALALAERNLERTTIISPISGIIQRVHVDIGENIPADQPVVRIVDISRIDVPIRLPANARPHLAIGADVVLSSPGQTHHWEGTISRIGPEDDHATRTMTAYIEFRQDASAASNGPPLLFPGQFVRAVVRSIEPEVRQVLPRRAVIGDRVRLVDGGTIRSRAVTIDYQVRTRFDVLGVEDEHWMVLREPLDENSLVVLDAARRLPDGLRVRPIDSAGEPMHNTAETEPML